MDDVFINNNDYIVDTRVWPNTRYNPLIKKSAKNPGYNCAAFAVNEQNQWFEPIPENLKKHDVSLRNYYWPAGIAKDIHVSTFAELYELYGFERDQTLNSGLERGIVKIAIYGDNNNEFTHAAVQLPIGNWASKLGANHDVEHIAPYVLEGPVYGVVKIIMRKSINEKSSRISIGR